MHAVAAGVVQHLRLVGKVDQGVASCAGNRAAGPAGGVVEVTRGIDQPADAGDLETGVGQLEHGAGIVRSAGIRRAEQVAFRVGNQAGVGKLPVEPGEAGQRDRRAGVGAGNVGNLEHRAPIVRSAIERGAEQVAVGVHDDTVRGKRPVAAIERGECDRRAGIAAAGLDEFEHRAVTVGAAALGGAEQIPGGIDDHRAVRACAIRGIEVDQHGRRAGVTVGGLGDLEDRALIVGAVIDRRAEQVAGRIGNQTGIGVRAVGAVQAGQHGWCAGIGAAAIGQFEYRAVAEPAALGRAKQVPSGVGDQAGIGATSGRAVETGQHGWRAGVAGTGTDDLEDRAVAVCPAGLCGAEQVAGGVGEQAALEAVTRAAVETGQIGRRGGVTCGCIGDLEHGADGVRSTVGRGAQQIAGGIEDQAGLRIGPVRAIEADHRRKGWAAGHRHRLIQVSGHRGRVANADIIHAVSPILICKDWLEIS